MLSCILQYIECPESVQVFLLLLKSMRVLLLVLRGSEFDSGFPPSLWIGGSSILSPQLHAGDTLQVEGLGFSLGNTTYSQYSVRITPHFKKM